MDKLILEELKGIDVDIAINKKADVCVITAETVSSSLAFEASRSNTIVAPNPVLATAISHQLSQKGIGKPVYHFELPATPATVRNGNGIFLLGHGTHSTYNGLLREPIVTSKSKKETKNMLGVASDVWLYEEKNPQVFACIHMAHSATCHMIKKFGLAGIPTISNNDHIKSQYVLNYVTGMIYDNPKSHNIRGDFVSKMKSISDLTKAYYTSICANPMERLQKIINGDAFNYNNHSNSGKTIYLSPEQNPRIKHEFYKASTILEALEKLNRLQFSKAYLIGYNETMSQDTKNDANILTRKLGPKVNNVIFCHDTPMPYRWGIQVIPTSYGIQLLS